MERLNEILKELGISKVKLAKFLGVSRQMIYNYLELDDLNKWPKDKKVLLLNLLGIKSADELKNIKVDTDYIMDVETRINSLFENTNKNLLFYCEDMKEVVIKDYLGKEYKVNDKSGCCLLPNTYKLGKSLEYAELISEKSSKRSIYKE